MFKDYDKYLSASLRVYIFVLICIFILKVVGFDYFGLDLNNPILQNLSNNHFGDLYNFISVYIQFYFYLCIVCNKRKLYKESLIGSLLNFIPQCILNVYYKLDIIYYCYSLLLMIIIPMIISKNRNIKKQIIMIILLTIYQSISLIIRNINVYYEYGNFVVDSILNIDQLLMLAITYNIYFMKGGIRLCGVEQVVGLFLQMKKNFLNLLKRLQRNLSKFKELNDEEKYTLVVYFILSLIWNLFTIFVVLFIAKLNDSIIECIFILISFWLSKRIFGKAFHLRSMLQCFIVSNITYYVLNRITTPIGISILIPIMLGTGLSYVTSKLVKKAYKPLYRGMPLDEFERSILQVTDKGSDKYNICYDYFINKENAIFLGRKYNYTDSGIRKIASRVNDKIKALN